MGADPAQTETNCADCGLFRRAPGLRVCSACWDVAQEQSMRVLMDRLRDPSHPPSKCIRCDRSETPEADVAAAIATDAEIVSFCALERHATTGAEGWVCSACMFGGSEGEEWKA